MRKIYSSVCALFILSSCIDEDSRNPELNPGYEFFPIEVGSFVEYRVDSIWHDQPDPEIEGIHDTTSYFVKELIESEIVDAQNDPSLRIVRYKRDSESDEWSLVDIWFAKRTAQNAEKVEENVRYIKLAFPISTSAIWNLNALNAKDEWLCRYDSIYATREIGDLSFPKTVKVMQRENKNLIDDELAFEIYAEEVGLIRRYEKDLTTQLSFVNEPIAANIRLGHEFNWEIIDYGIE